MSSTELVYAYLHKGISLQVTVLSVLLHDLSFFLSQRGLLQFSKKLIPAYSNRLALDVMIRIVLLFYSYTHGWAGYYSTAYGRVIRFCYSCATVLIRYWTSCFMTICAT